MKTTHLILLYIAFLSACSASPSATTTQPLASFSPTPEAAPVASSTPNQAQPTEQRTRSEEHTSELQSPRNLVCRLLLDKKKTNLTRAVISARKRNTWRRSENR